MRLLYLFICICTLFVTLWEFVKLVLLIEMCGGVGWVCRCLYEFLLSRHFRSLLICVVALSVISYGGPQLSRQNQKPHDKNITAKPKYLTAKTKYLVAKPNTSLQEQNSFGFAMGICFCREVFGFCCEVFGLAMRSLVLP